jgi:hypothetical protein
MAEPASVEYDISEAEGAHFQSRRGNRWFGLFFSALFFFVAILAFLLLPTRAPGSLQRFGDYFGIAFGIAVGILMAILSARSFSRGPQRVRITNEALVLDFPMGREEPNPWNAGIPFRIFDRRGRDVAISGAQCVAFYPWSFRSFGLSGPACNAILDAAREHDLEVRNSGRLATLWFGAITHRIVRPKAARE